MNVIVNNVSFYMEKGSKSAEAQIFNEQDDLYDITEEQLNTVLHPTSKWVLHMEFDGRASNPSDISAYSQTISRVEHFEPHATLRDVLERIANGDCFGYMEGIEGDNGVFYLQWGT